MLRRSQDLFATGQSEGTGTEAPPAGPREEHTQLRKFKPCFAEKEKEKRKKGSPSNIESQELGRITCRYMCMRTHPRKILDTILSMLPFEVSERLCFYFLFFSVFQSVESLKSLHHPTPELLLPNATAASSFNKKHC